MRIFRCAAGVVFYSYQIHQMACERETKKPLSHLIYHKLVRDSLLEANVGKSKGKRASETNDLEADQPRSSAGWRYRPGALDRCRHVRFYGL